MSHGEANQDIFFFAQYLSLYSTEQARRHDYASDFGRFAKFGERHPQRPSARPCGCGRKCIKLNK